MNLVVLANGVLLLAMSAFMALVAALFADTRDLFLETALLAGVVGGMVTLAVANRRDDFQLVHSFLLTCSIWITGAAAGALPLWLAGLSATDAFFEAMSGITTTGSTVMTGLDDTPKGLLLWRAILQWLGGIGFIVAGIAVLPILRVGGMQLFHTESSDRSEKEMATAARFAAATFWVYLALTVLCLVIYRLGGMTRFEAVVHALTTLSTGGYSTSDSSFGHFPSPFLQWAGTLFMLAGAVPFAWYIRMLTGKGLRSEQVRAMMILFAVSIGLLTLWRVWTSGAPVEESLRLVAFNVVSVVTTTGYATTDYTTWGPFAAAAFLFLTALGGCSGSTAGGAKMMRWIVFLRVTRVRLARIRNPSAVMIARYDRRPLTEDIANGVAVFFVLYGVTVLGLAMGLALYELDLATSLSGALTAVANVGPGIGGIIGPAGTFQSLPDGAKWLLCFGMYAGRLEMMTVFVLFSGRFWREAL